MVLPTMRGCKKIAANDMEEMESKGERGSSALEMKRFKVIESKCTAFQLFT